MNNLNAANMMNKIDAHARHAFALASHAFKTCKHADFAVAAVAASIRQFGFRQPIVVDADGVIVVGHTRWKAAKSLGLAEVPVHVAADLTPEQARAYRIADNKTASLAEWDDDLLVAELKRLQEADFDVSGLGFDTDELADLLNEGTEGLTDPDEVPEEVETRCKPGDLWILGRHRLLCGDSTSVDDVARLMDGAVAEMMFTDPPYGVDYSGGIQFMKDGTSKTNNREKLAHDDSTAIYADFLPVAISAVDGPCYMWFSDSKIKDVYDSIY
jgi:site-specific DNA-methyltransferase (adenine-specific)